MIVDDLNIFRPCVSPPEADPVLIVDPNTVLSGAIASELLEAVARWNAKILKGFGRIQCLKLTNGDTPERLWKSLANRAGRSAVEQVLRRGTAERSDHPRKIAWMSCYDNGEAAGAKAF